MCLRVSADRRVLVFKRILLMFRGHAEVLRRKFDFGVTHFVLRWTIRLIDQGRANSQSVPTHWAGWLSVTACYQESKPKEICVTLRLCPEFRHRRIEVR